VVSLGLEQRSFWESEHRSCIGRCPEATPFFFSDRRERDIGVAPSLGPESFCSFLQVPASLLGSFNYLFRDPCSFDLAEKSSLVISRLQSSVRNFLERLLAPGFFSSFSDPL